MTISIIRTKGDLTISTPYDSMFVFELKRLVPAGDRAWVAPNWIVTARHERSVLDIISTVWGVYPQIIDKTSQSSTPVIKMIKLEYLGRCKDKSPDEPMASGWVDGNWTVAFRESALRAFFDGTEVPTSQNSQAAASKPKDDTYYTILGVSLHADPNDVKKAYRRMAKQWHPDVNKGDPDAAEMFRKINDANATLSDPMKRKKYDFILRLVTQDLAQQNQTTSTGHISYDDIYSSDYGYRSPLRCGLLLVEGSMILGRLVVSKIHSWDDIMDNGKMMVSSWPSGAKTFSVSWV